MNAPAAQAATLYIDTTDSVIGRGDAEIFQVRLDTDEAAEECVNAASGVIEFSGPITPIDVSTGESIFSIWVEQPTVNPENNTVTFAGGVPNGYCGRVAGDPSLTNTLFEIVARADSEAAADGEPQAAVASFTQTEAFLNDGFGTRADLRTLPAEVTVRPVASTLVSDPWTERVTNDAIPPQAFSVQLTKDPIAFSSEYYIVFNTTDKETGVDRYEVMEEPMDQIGAFLWGRADAPWQTARSPYTLDDQSLNSIIRVKAIDKAGNEYIANLVPDEELRSVSPTQIITYVALASLAAVVGLLGLMVVRSIRSRRLAAMDSFRTDQDNETDHFVNTEEEDTHYHN